MNKREFEFLKSAYRKFMKVATTKLEEVYKKPSSDKKLALKCCIQDKEVRDGYRGRIVKYNSNIFTYGYIYNDEFNNKYFVYITHRNKYIILIDDKLKEIRDLSSKAFTNF